jgi:hypothetical protein
MVPCSVKCFFDIQENRSRGHIVIEVEGHVVCKPHALKRRAVTCMKPKLARIQCVTFFSVPLDYFRITLK